MKSPLPVQTISVTKGGGPTDPAHDEKLRRGIIDTTVSRPVAFAMSFVFLALVYVVPIGQAIAEKVKGEDSPLLGLFEHAPTKASLRQFEKDLEQASYPKDFVQPRLQLLLSALGRVGNKRCVIGQERWLYYAPGVTHVAGPSFLDPDIVHTRESEAPDDGATAPHADPRPAILAFNDAMAKRGIKLILFPVPDKAMLQPLELHGRGDRSGPVPVPRNPGWQPFVDELRAKGVAIFDPAPLALVPGETPRYLEQDTHWTPTWMEQVAKDLSRFAEETASLPPPSGAPTLHARADVVKRVGDLVDMLKLPEGQNAFRPQTVTVHTVEDEAGTAWEADPTGDVLLLGDSFSNVFTMEPMGWGVAAGLAPQLALALGRRVDVIAQNDSGAFVTRQALARELAAGEDRLAGKKVVIWEFASRELSVGDWKPMDWTSPGARVGAGAP